MDEGGRGFEGERGLTRRAALGTAAAAALAAQMGGGVATAPAESRSATARARGLGRGGRPMRLGTVAAVAKRVGTGEPVAIVDLAAVDRNCARLDRMERSQQDRVAAGVQDVAIPRAAGVRAAQARPSPGDDPPPSRPLPSVAARARGDRLLDGVSADARRAAPLPRPRARRAASGGAHSGSMSMGSSCSARWTSCRSTPRASCRSMSCSRSTTGSRAAASTPGPSSPRR